MTSRHYLIEFHTGGSGMPARNVTTKPAETVDVYIASAPKDRRATLTKLRQTIKAAAPMATEIVSYGMGGFKQDGERVAYFAYWKRHTGVYGASREFIDTPAAQPEAYVQSKGTL